MRLISIQIHNFRQFYGTTPKMMFSHGDRNITVIHGSNGAGKTTLLNAFTWTLFDSLTPGFLIPDDKVNHRAMREANIGDSVDAWVEIEFEHDDRKFLVKRSVSAQRTEEIPKYKIISSPYPSMQWWHSDGTPHTEALALDVIGKILPKYLHSYFFFDGERIERIVKPSKKDEISKSAKMLLGVEVFIRAEKHLKAVRKELEKEHKDVGDEETAKLYSKKSLKEDELAKLEERQKEIDLNITAHEERKAEIDDKLKQAIKDEAIKNRREQLKFDIANRRASLKQGNKNLSDTISKDSYILFLQEPIKKFKDLIDALRERGELPAGIKKQFVNDLLANERCICDRELKDNSEPKKSVEEWMQKAGLADVEEKAIRMGGETTALSDMIPRTLDHIDQIQQKRESDRVELSRIEGELEDIGEKIVGGEEEASKLQIQLTAAEETIRSLLVEKTNNANAIKQLTDIIEELENNIEKLEAAEARQVLAKSRVEAARNAAHRISMIRELMEKDFRRGLQKKISKLFSTISVTPYVPEIADDYSVMLLDSAGGSPLPVATSQGESQILSLSFIGSIIEQAREKYAKHNELSNPDTSTYPVVMDSPFGALDSNHRRQIAEHLPILADQLVVFVTKTQWRGEVEQAMKSRLSKSYVLTYYTPREDVRAESTDINSKVCDLIKRSSNEFEYTEISEV